MTGSSRPTASNCSEMTSDESSSRQREPAGLRRVRRRRGRRRARGDCGQRQRCAPWCAHAAGRALRLPRRHGHGRRRDQLRGPLWQAQRRDDAARARRRRRPAGAHRRDGRSEQAAGRHAGPHPRAVLRHVGLQVRGRPVAAGRGRGPALPRVGHGRRDGRRSHRGLVVETKSGRQAIRANVFIDGCGDADVAAFAGVPFEVGDGHGSGLFPIDHVPRRSRRCAARAWPRSASSRRSTT